MASTPLLKTPNDYIIQQKSYKDGTTYNLYEYSQHGKPGTTLLPILVLIVLV